METLGRQIAIDGGATDGQLENREVHRVLLYPHERNQQNENKVVEYGNIDDRNDPFMRLSL